MPSGRIAEDGTFRMGYSFAKPYSTIWTSAAVLPRVELYARFVRIMHVAGGPVGDPVWAGYGDYKDKIAGGKLLLLEEDWHTPSVAFGINDVQGTGLFSSKYLAASKQFGAMETTLGIGTGRIAGVFGGMRYAPSNWDGVALAAEYDANNYRNDYRAADSGVINRKKGIGLALEYRTEWLGAQLSYRDGKPGINAYTSVPLEVKEWVPKLDEPEADMEVVERPSFERWSGDSKYRRDLIGRLLKQNFKNIHLKVSENTVEATLTNTRISLPSRAVGRAVRTILLRAPLGIRQIKIHYTVAGQAFATYTFFDANRLQRYFNGLESRKQLAPYVAIEYAEPLRLSDGEDALDGLEEEHFESYIDGSDGDVLSYRGEGAGLDRIRLAPGFGLYFNDPSGALRYEVLANASYEKQLDEGLFLKTGAQLTLLENISGVTQPSNSLLPHVRTDVANYKKTGRIKLNQALVNKFFQPEQRLYGRATAGFYEEMYAGAGGQVLYYPERAPWAVDVTVDALKQRDAGGGFAFRPYSTVTALGALHYRLPIQGLTATVRGGRFLAKDVGARFELKRRFRSGFEIGGWYTLTNGNDITTPGTPTKPYHDKGVFMVMSLSAMLTKDTPATPRMSISPWTRDVGQMVNSPGDLYDVMESAYVNMHDHDGLQYFGDLDDRYDLPQEPTILDRIQWQSWQSDRKHVADALTSADTWQNVGVGLVLSAMSSVVDGRADRWAAGRQGKRINRLVAKVGNNLPLAVGGMSALLALDSSNERMSTTSFTALEAGLAGVMASETAKYAVGRDRPQVGLGNRSFHPMRLKNGNTGFPSGHTTAMWAMVTPYAKEYDAPWLYGVAAVTNAARVVDRKHFVSDTVGGALLGYAIGGAFWRWHHGAGPLVGTDGQNVTLTWKMD